MSLAQPVNLQRLVPAAATITFLAVIVQSTQAQTVSPVDEQALRSLYNSTNGDSWTCNAGWLSGPVSSWGGVTIANQRVTEIDLSNCNLMGTIPPEIRLLRSLERLDLPNNQLQSPIPDELWALPALVHLDMSYNNLTGMLPDSLVTPMNNYLSLSNNRLEGPIPQYFESRYDGWYRQIDLSHNSFSGGFGLETFADIRYVDISHNNLSQLPPSKERGWAWDVALDASHNQISGNLPEWLSDNSQSWFLLDLSHNSLSGSLHSGLSCIHDPGTVDLSHNRISGEIPVDFGKDCVAINLEHNQLSGSIPTFHTNLQDLDLSDNQFAEIGTGLFSSIDLTRLDLSTNALDNSIVARFGDLQFLEELDLAGNQFSGEIPTEWSTLVSLQKLNLSNNSFSGDIPSFLGTFRALEALDLSP